MKELVRLSLKYPPSTRALLGAMLNEINEESTKSLKASLNPITKYKVPGDTSYVSRENGSELIQFKRDSLAENYEMVFRYPSGYLINTFNKIKEEEK